MPQRLFASTVDKFPEDAYDQWTESNGMNGLPNPFSRATNDPMPMDDTDMISQHEP